MFLGKGRDIYLCSVKGQGTPVLYLKDLSKGNVKTHMVFQAIGKSSSLASGRVKGVL